MISGSRCRRLVGRLVVATSLLGYFGTSILIDSVATGLRLIACTCMGYLNNIYRVIKKNGLVL